MRWLRRLLWTFGVVVAALVALIAWRTWPRQRVLLTDAQTIRAAIDQSQVREVLWRPPVALPAGVNGDADDSEPCLSADGNLLIFVRGRPGGGADLYECTRADGNWSPARALTAVNSPHDDMGPLLSPDGRTLYYHSDRPGGTGGYDLWRAVRDGDGWRPAENLGPRVNSPEDDYGAALAPDGGQLLFASNRPHGAATQPADKLTGSDVPGTPRDFDLYQSSLTPTGFDAAESIGALNSTTNEVAPCFSPAGDFLYFASDRAGGRGGFDLMRSRRIRGHFAAPEFLGSEVNTAANELDPALEPGGFALVFASDRSGDRAVRSGYDLYRSESREVFRDVEESRAELDWAGLWQAIRPHLLLGLLALGAALLLATLLRDLRDRRLSLLARCLLASLLVHALLMLLFSTVQVTTSVAAFLRGRGPIIVSLAPTAEAATIAGQVRGSLTDPPALPAAKLSRVEAPAPRPDAPAAEIRVSAAPSKQPELADVSLSVNDPAAKARPAEPAPIRPAAAPSADVPTAASLPEIAAPTDAPEPVNVPEADGGAPHVAPPSHVEPGAATLRLAVTTSGPADVVARIEPGRSAATATDSAESSFGSEVEPVVDAPATLAKRNESVETALAPHEMELTGPVETASAPSDSAKTETTPGLAQLGAKRLSAPAAAVEIPGSPQPDVVALAPAGREANAASARDSSLVSPPVAEPAAASPRQSRAAPVEPHLPLAAAPLELGLPDEKAPPEAPTQRVIRGQVRDMRTREPLAGAEVRLDLLEREPLVAAADARGRYELAVPELPDHVALTATARRHVPSSVNVANDAWQGDALEVNFELDPASARVIAIEAQPEVHHLGNDRFEGRINSQFQRESEGLRFRAEFDVAPEQLGPQVASAMLELMARGVQCPHQVRINGEELPRRMRESPADGSYGRLRVLFDPAILRPGRNVLVIRNVTCRSDIDDFEFVNIHIRLISDDE